MSELDYRRAGDAVVAGVSNYIRSRDPKEILQNGRLYSTSGRYIGVDEACATYFLEQCCAKKVALDDHLEAIVVLLELARLTRPKNGKFHHLKPMLLNSAKALLVHLDESLPDKSIDERLESNAYHGAVGTDHYVSSVIFNAREIAYRAYIKSVMNHIINGSEIDDLHGDVYLKISNLCTPVIKDDLRKYDWPYLDELMGGFSTIKNGWSFTFHELGIKPWNFIYMSAAYKSVIPYLSQALKADVELIQYLDD